MKRFVTILLLALAAALTTCTPCEAKRRNHKESKRFYVDWEQLRELVRPYVDDKMRSVDGNYHLFEYPGQMSKMFVLLSDHWCFDICPYSYMVKDGVEPRTFFHYADGTIEEILSDEQFETIKMNIYAKTSQATQPL